MVEILISISLGPIALNKYSDYERDKVILSFRG